MRISLKELRDQLALVRTMTGDTRKAQIKALKEASVFELDKDNKEIDVRVEIEVPEEIEKAAKDAGEHRGISPDELAKAAQAAADRAVAEANKAFNGGNPLAGKSGIWSPPDGVKHYNTKHFAGDRNGKSGMERAFRFGQWILASLGNEKAKQFCADQGLAHVKLAQETVNSSGGYLVPEEFGTDLIDLREKYGVVRKLFKMRPMASDTRTDPRRVSGLSAYFVSEGGAGTESTKGWDQVRLTAKDIMVLSRITNQLSQDAVINIGDDLAYEIAYAYALKEDQCGLIGTGTSTYGGIVGVTQKLLGLSGTIANIAGLYVATGNLFSEFTLADFNATVGKLPQYADGPVTKWTAHRTFYYGTMQRLELAAGGVTSYEVREGNRVPKFLGYPVEISQVMPSTDSNSQVAACLGDFEKGASFGDRQQTTIMFSEHATVGGESVFERNEIAVRGMERVDINVHDVGNASATAASRVPGPIVGIISAAS